MKKSFLRILSITVTLLMIAGMVMMPVSAADPTIGTTGFKGYTKNKMVFYRATDAADATVTTTVDGTETTTATPYLSSDDSVWKFAVGTLGDTFKPSSADFAAPKAEAVKGDGIKLSWNAPAEGKAIVKIVGDNYNKEVVTTASSITLGDTEIGKSYQVQVTVGDKSSQILAYNNIYSPIAAKNAGNDTNYITIDRFDANGEVTNQWGWTVFNVADYVDMIGENTGFIFRVESVIDPEQTFNITHYYDYNNQTGIKEWKEYESKDEYINSADSGIAFNTYLGAMETNAPDDGGEGGNAHKYFEPNADATRTVYRIDTTGKGIHNSVKTTTITGLGGMKNNFKSGYIIVPFDVVGEAGLEIIKEYGIFSLTTEAYRYYPKNTFQTAYAGGQSWISTEQLAYQYTDIDTEKTGNIAVMQDREIFLGDAGFISDIDAFIATCTDISSAENADVDISKLAKASDNGKTYMQLVEGTTYELTNEAVASKYVYSSISGNQIRENYNGFTYTTAAGEKMMLGFTAQQDGKYEISAPIFTTKENGVTYRLIKESADGTKSVLQKEATYNGEEHFTLMLADLVAGDTVWFEAWANVAGTEIKIGVPQFTLLSGTGVIKSDGSLYIRSLNYTDGRVLQTIDAMWDVGYFINPFLLNGTECVMAPATEVTAEGAVIVTDQLGVSKLSATDDPATEANETDATTLFGALHTVDAVRSGGGYYMSKYNTFKYIDGTATGTAGYLDVTTTQMADNYSYKTVTGFGVAFAGGTKLSYYSGGTYFQFTAPSDGVADFAVADRGGVIGSNAYLLKNTTVISDYVAGTEGDVLANASATGVELKKGDTLTLCFWSSDQSVISNYITDPAVTFTPAVSTEKTVTFDQQTDNLIPDTYAEGAKITLPAVAKNGAIFEGWNDGTTTYAAGTEYTVNADTEFTAQYIYYGDLDGVGEIAQAADVTVLRKMIIGAAETGATDKANLTGDIDANGTISLVDLVKLKKMSAGIDVTVGAK